MKPFRNIEIDGQRIACYESGGKGQTLFFIHSNSTSTLLFEPQFEGALGEKYSLIGIDLPGHGQSAPATNPEEIYSLPGYADIIIGAAKILDAEDAIFAGWSLGGHILLEASDRLHNAKGLMIFGAPPLGNPPQMEQAFISGPGMNNIFKARLSDEEIREWVATQFSLEPGIDIPSCFGVAIMSARGDARAFLGESFMNLRYRDELKAIENINVPLAILHGEKDRCVNLEYLKEIKSPALWRNEIQVISGAGHSPQWEKSAAFNALVGEFIDDLHYSPVRNKVYNY